MPRLDPKKREEAYKLRLQGKSFAEIARTLHMSPKTVRRLEYGWVDKKGVRHPGWQEDVGRTRNTSELVVLERRPKRLIYRYGRSFDRSRFKDQEASLRKMLKRSRRLKRLCIDRHGIGMNMAENLHSEFRSRVEGVAMIGPVKESLAVGLHIVLENEEISIPRDRNLIAQVHSIKKSPTNAGYSRYDTETNARAHADVLWALALAVHAAGITRERKRRRKIVTASVI